ncbi:MAG: hypothetical protein RLZZ362_1401 [Actinomycetota bacterium]
MTVKMDVKRLLMGTVAIAGLLVASCGGGNDGGASTSQVDQVLDNVAKAVAAEGGTLDRDCAKAQLDTMNAADLATLATAAVDQDVTLSDEGEALGDALAACIAPPTEPSPAPADTAPVDTADSATTGDTIDVTGMSTDELREQLITLVSGSLAGMTVDEQCVREAVGKLSDDDLRAIVAAGQDGDPTVSAEADAIGASLVECVTDFGDELDTSGTGPIPDGIAMTDALIDLFVDQIEATGLQADRPCIEQALAGIDVAQLAGVMNNSELMSTLSACITP